MFPKFKSIIVQLLHESNYSSTIATIVHLGTHSYIALPREKKLYFSEYVGSGFRSQVTGFSHSHRIIVRFYEGNLRVISEGFRGKFSDRPTRGIPKDIH